MTDLERSAVRREVEFEVIQAARRPRPMCRDCADADGRCPSTGRLCDPYQAALEFLRTAAIPQRVK